MLQNGWILAGVLVLGWSASVTIGGFYLETLFCSMALQRAVRLSGRAHIASGESIPEDGVVRSGTLADSTRKTTFIGLAQGVFMLVFGAGAYLDETLDPIWRLPLVARTSLRASRDSAAPPLGPALANEQHHRE